MNSNPKFLDKIKDALKAKLSKVRKEKKRSYYNVCHVVSVQVKSSFYKDEFLERKIFNYSKKRKKKRS